MRPLPALLAGLLLNQLPSAALGCSQPTQEIRYKLDEHQRLVYVENQHITPMPQANPKKFHPVGWSPDWPKNVGQWHDGDGSYGRFFYFRDDKHVYWRGLPLQNPPGTPPVDPNSFTAKGTFAADRDSIYFGGKRIDDNDGEKKINISTLSNLPYLYTDQHNLYSPYTGHYIGPAEGYRVVAERNPDYDPYGYPCGGAPSTEIIAQTRYQVLLNGTPLSGELNGKTVNADSASFRLIDWQTDWDKRTGRWRIYRLKYRDVHGTHVFQPYATH